MADAPTQQEIWAEKIAKLLKKAESTTPEEAELLIEKAMAIQAKWAISDAMVDQVNGKETSEKIIEARIVMEGIYHAAKYMIGAKAAHANKVRYLISKGSKTTTLILIGFESDVHRVEQLNSSLQIQALAAMTAWARDPSNVPSYMTPMQKFKAKRSFLFGFADGVGHKLELAAKKGREEYRDEQVAAGKDAEEVSTGMELMIRSREDRVNDWIDHTYGKLRTVSQRYSEGRYGSRSAGSFAGRNADVGSGGALRQRRQIGS